MKLFYNDKIYESCSLTLEVVKPKLNVSVSEEIKAGDPIRVEVSTNRDGDTGYSGIFFAFIRKNYKALRFIELEKEGKSRVTFETAGLFEGTYWIYIRDTSLILRNIDLNTFSENYYDLDPTGPIARFFYAHDDVYLLKTVRIVKTSTSKPNAIVF